MDTFLNFMGDNYNRIKSNLSNLCKGFNNNLFDEDVFHDTIIKVDKNIGSKILLPDEYEKYMHKSFRTNLVREKLYHRNSKTDHTFDFSMFENPYTMDYVEHTIDFGVVISILDKKFGIKLTRAYIDWLSGYSVKDIMEKHEIDSGYYHIKQMTNYIRGYCKNNMIIY